MTAPADVLSLAMQLPERERADIAHHLLQSLEPETVDDDGALSSAWEQEIEARLQKIAAGTHETHDWRQAIQEIRQELKKDAEP